jgi:hypothetical protein
LSSSEKDLGKLLRVSPAKLAFLDALSEADRKRLAEDVARASQLHSHHIRKSMAEALNHIPWILRAPVRALFR